MHGDHQPQLLDDLPPGAVNGRPRSPERECASDRGEDDPHEREHEAREEIVAFLHRHEPHAREQQEDTSRKERQAEDSQAATALADLNTIGRNATIERSHRRTYRAPRASRVFTPARCCTASGLRRSSSVPGPLLRKR